MGFLTVKVGYYLRITFRLLKIEIFLRFTHDDN